MAIITPGQADFTAYNAPGGQWAAVNGWSILMPSSHPADTQWHGYERAWPGSAVEAWTNSVYSAWAYQWAAGVAVRRGTAAIICNVTSYIEGGGNFAEQWTLPGTFGAFVGSANASNTSTNDGLDFANPRTATRIRLVGTTLTFEFSTGPTDDPVRVVANSTDITTWLGGVPTHWMLLARRVAGTANYGAFNAWGYEETA